MSRSLRYLFLLFVFTAVGCNQCGERRHLFPCLHDRMSRDDGPDNTRDRDARRTGTGKECCPEGSAVSRNGASFGGETLSYPGNGGMIYSGPSYPMGQPYPSGNPRSDELPPPGSTIPSPGVPYAPNRPIDSTKLQPKMGGMMTGDLKR